MRIIDKPLHLCIKAVPIAKIQLCIYPSNFWRPFPSFLFRSYDILITHEKATKKIEPPIQQLQAIILARKRSAKVIRLVPIDDTLHRRIRSAAQKQQTHPAKADVKQEPQPAANTPILEVSAPIVGLAHAEVRHAPVDESEEGVEERAHQRQQIREEGDDLGYDESQDPEHGKDTGPRGPAEHGVVAHVPGVVEEAEKDEARGYGSVKHAEEDDGRDHEREGHLQVDLVSDGAECGSGHILCAGVCIHDAADKTENDDFSDRDGPESLGEVFGLLHLGDEAGKRNLANEGVADVHKGTHSRNKSGTCRRNGQDDRLNWSFLGWVALRVVHDTAEDGSKQNRNEGEQGRSSRTLGKSPKCAREGADPGNDSHDGGESNGAYRMAGHGVEVFCANQAVQSLNKSIVQKEHDGGEPECPAVVVKDHLAKIANITNFRMAHAELPTDGKHMIRLILFEVVVAYQQIKEV